MKGGREAWQTRIDAITGEVLSSEPTSNCSPTSLFANSQYYRQGGNSIVPFVGEAYGSSYALVRGNLFGVHAGDVLNPIYTSSSSTFGDGLEYVWGNPWTGSNGQTQASDIMIGLNKAYDFYLGVYGRQHIDGSNGYYVATAAHQDNLGDPARAWWAVDFFGHETYWIDFRSQLVPGNPGGPTELSVTAHEWTHLVNYRSARVGRATNDSFGAHAVNEGMSTILGTACRLWDSTGGAGGIGYPSPDRWKFDWSYEPQYYGSQPTDPEVYAVEYLYRPSKAPVREPSWWTSTGEGTDGDVHRAAAPLHRAFYFMANGAMPLTDPSTDSDETRGRTTPFLPWGFDGLGAHNAALVFYQALTQTMHQSTDLQRSALDLISAGNQLFGNGSPSSKTVRKALAAVNLITPEYFQTPWAPSSNTPSSAVTVPIPETYFQISGAFQDTDGSYYLRLTLPPYASILLSSTSGIPSVGQYQEALGIEVRSSDGSTILETGEASIDWSHGPDPIRWPTLDPLPDPPPDPPEPTTATAFARYNNPSGSPLEVLVRLRSQIPRTQDLEFYGSGVVQYREPIENSYWTTQW